MQGRINTILHLYKVLFADGPLALNVPDVKTPVNSLNNVLLVNCLNYLHVNMLIGLRKENKKYIYISII